MIRREREGATPGSPPPLPNRLARRLPPHLLVAGFAAIVAYAAVAQGAFFTPAALAVPAALVALALLGGILLPPAVLGGLSLLVAGLVASAIANGWPPEAWLPLAAVGGAGGAFSVVRRLALAGHRDAVHDAIAWTAAAVAALGMVGVAFHLDGLALVATDLRRASSTLTYANATAALLVLALPSALLGQRAGRPPGRVVTFVILSGLLLTVSRGGIAAAALLIGVAAAIGARGALRRLGWPLAGALMAAGATLPSVVGDAAAPVPAVAGWVVGGLLAAAPWRIGRRAMAMGAAIGVVAVAVAILSAGGLDRLVRSRIVPPAEGRLSNWSRTLDAALRDPWFGTGPGTYRQEASRAAHNEYLQVLAETGVVGLASVIGASGLFATALGRARRPDDGWALATAGTVAFAAHSAVDFLWRFPLLIVVAFSLLAAGTTRERVEGPGPEPLR